jgi:hypothetical protein
VTRRQRTRLRVLFNRQRRAYRVPSGVAPFERYVFGRRVFWFRLACDAEEYRHLPDFTLCGSIRVKFLDLQKEDTNQASAG